MILSVIVCKMDPTHTWPSLWWHHSLSVTSICRVVVCRTKCLPLWPYSSYDHIWLHPFTLTALILTTSIVWSHLTTIRSSDSEVLMVVHLQIIDCPLHSPSYFLNFLILRSLNKLFKRWNTVNYNWDNYLIQSDTIGYRPQRLEEKLFRSEHLNRVQCNFHLHAFHREGSLVWWFTLGFFRIFRILIART